MAFYVDPTDDNQKNGTKAFIADFEADITTLPTSSAEGTGGISSSDNDMVAKASSCLCLENSSIYYLNSEDTWVQL